MKKLPTSYQELLAWLEVQSQLELDNGVTPTVEDFYCRQGQLRILKALAEHYGQFSTVPTTVHDLFQK